MATVSDGGPIQENASSAIRRIVSKEMVDGELIEGVSLFGGAAPVSGVTPEVLLHLDSNTTDSSGNDATVTIGGSFPPTPQYVTPTDIGYTDGGGSWVSTQSGGGFSTAFHIGGNSGVNNDRNWLKFPTPSIGEGAFTFECFIEPVLTHTSQAVFSYDDPASGAEFMAYFTNSGGVTRIQLYNKDSSGTVQYALWGFDWTETGKAKHYAIQRAAKVGSTAQWDLYFDGNKIAHTAWSGNTGDLNAIDISGGNVLIGQFRESGGVNNAALYVDEVRLTKSLVYSGSTYSVPVVPHSVSSGGSGSKINKVRHKLGRKAKGAMVVKRSGTSDIQVLSSNSANEISISSTNDVKVSLWVF